MQNAHGDSVGSTIPIKLEVYNISLSVLGRILKRRPLQKNGGNIFRIFGSATIGPDKTLSYEIQCMLARRPLLPNS